MFHAGLVTPSWFLLLQLEIPGEPTLSPVGLLVGLHLPDAEPPVPVGDRPTADRVGSYEGELLLTFEIVRVLVGVVLPVLCGLTTPCGLAAPIGAGKAAGLAELAAREKATRH